MLASSIQKIIDDIVGPKMVAVARQLLFDLKQTNCASYILCAPYINYPFRGPFEPVEKPKIWEKQGRTNSPQRSIE